MADKIVYTGMIDEYYDYCFGELEYRSLRFETEVLPDVDNYQGNAVVNYTDSETPYTRIIEHKHNDLYQKYAEKAEEDNKVIFGGRLGKYKYYDMDDTIEVAINDYRAL